MFLTLDFETYWDADFTLKKLSTLEYIRDPRFEVHLAAIKCEDQKPVPINGANLANWFKIAPWNEIDLITHNANFDVTVLFEKYGIRPRSRIDTLGLCRALLPRGIDFDLGNICSLLGLGEKGKELINSKGKRDLTDEERNELGGYACNDAELTWKLFQALWPDLPECERHTMDLVIRMSCEGRLLFDRAVGEETRIAIEKHRQSLIDTIGITKEQVRSRDEFATLLVSRGIEPPSKISPKTKEITYAFSKNDPEFVRLKSDPRAADLINARLAWTSNNAVTRIERLIKITDQAPYTLPMQLNYNGAHTGRLSGGGGINMQALNSRGPQAELRHAIIAPPGWVIVVRDLSGIELRMNMCFSKQMDMVDLIRSGGDPYIAEAAGQFKIAYEQVSKTQRQYGKVIQLGCGFRMGVDRFRDYAAAGPLGMDPIYMTREQAADAVYGYRRNNPWVKASWEWWDNFAFPMMASKSCNEEHKYIRLEHEAVVLPNGMRLRYPNLTASDDGWFWGLGDEVNYIHGGVAQENAVQALAGVVIKTHMNRMDDEFNGDAFVVHQVHDEILVLCREADAPAIDKRMDEIMTETLPWAPDLPLKTEGGWDAKYSK